MVIGATPSEDSRDVTPHLRDLELVTLTLAVFPVLTSTIASLPVLPVTPVVVVDA